VTRDGIQSRTPSIPASSASHEDPGSRLGIASADDLIRGVHNLGFPNVAEGEFFFDDRNRLGGLAVQGVLKLDGYTMAALMESYHNILILSSNQPV